VEGIAAIQQRIRAIESHFPVAPAPAPVRPAAAPAAVMNASAATFEAALTTAVEEQGAARLTPARRLAPGQYGRLQPPAELTRFGNGLIPADALTSIGVGDHRLYDPAAKAFNQLADDARRAGVTVGVTDSYRDLAGQERVAAEKGLFSQGGLAAKPGTSTHGWGLSVDLKLDARAQAWMRDNGHRYGFVEDVPREPWHWTYRPT
jgi:zinc D-Ala-D-Ala carboxypeptidase